MKATVCKSSEQRIFSSESDQTARCEHLMRVRFAPGFFTLLVINTMMHGQDSLFVTRSGSNLVLEHRPFYAYGVNSYFLQNLAAIGDTTHITEIFRRARQLGLTTLRTWAFFDSPDSTNPAVIQLSPGRFNETGLRALDYVVAEAKAYSIRLILPLVNNWEDYGGINQYVRWFAEQFPKAANSPSVMRQRTIQGAHGRSYRFRITSSLTHDDFFINSDIMQWYKNYVSMLLQRRNSVTNVKYKDESAILAWELANEPRSSDPSGEVIRHWTGEISSFVKSIDANHLIGTGEEGFDISSASYTDPSLYNNQTWLFNGSTGISFVRNTQLPNIDFASIHCYPQAWGLTLGDGSTWLNDHNRIADNAQKPLIMGEVGEENQADLFFEATLNDAYFHNTAGILPWQLVYDMWQQRDGYSFSCPRDSAICRVIETYATRYEQKKNGNSLLPSATSLFQNYPNPFNSVTIISYDLTSERNVRLEVFDARGQFIALVEDKRALPGYHAALFDGALLASGPYFVRFLSEETSQTRKILLLK